MFEALKMRWLGMKKKKQRQRERARAKKLLVNGFSNGKSNRIRTFTSQELKKKMFEALKMRWLGIKKKKQRERANTLVFNGCMLQEPFINGKSNRIQEHQKKVFETLKMWWLGTKKKKQREREREKNLLVNGSMLQEQLIGFSNGKSNRIRTFTSLELQEATNAYKFPIKKYSDIFKGYFQNIPISVHTRWSRPNVFYSTKMNVHKKVINSIVFASQMSVHKNALKLLGVCLEEKNAIPVYEWAEHSSLPDRLLIHPPSGTDTHQQQQPPLPWKLRLKIAAEVANVVVYLHTAFPRPILHREIRASHVLLDQQNVAKLCDFSLCIPIPEGEVRVEADYHSPALGYEAPEYSSTHSCSEKTDVFSFGILLLVLLTARPAWPWEWHFHEDVTLLDRARHSVKDNRLADIVDPRILAEPFAGCPGMNQQLERFAELALSCAVDREEDRPEMIDVEKQLWQMEQSTPNTCGTVISEGMP